MAQAMYCDSDGADLAAFLITEIETGSVSAACFPHLLGWCEQLLSAAGYTITSPADYERDEITDQPERAVDSVADLAEYETPATPAPASHRAHKAAPKHKAAKRSTARPAVQVDQQNGDDQSVEQTEAEPLAAVAGQVGEPDSGHEQE